MATYYAIADIAHELGCSVQLVRRHARAGRLKGVNIGTGRHREWRFTREAVDQFLRRCESAAPEAERPKFHTRRYRKSIKCGETELRLAKLG